MGHYDRKIALTLLGAIAVGCIEGHGYMVSPAARNSAWRFGFGTPANYNDNELYCGGRTVQHGRNGGRCGVCGDPWDVPEPRPHERGGRFGRGVITETYTEGQVIPVTIHMSANHRGHYEFRLCNNNNPNAKDSQRCLDKQLLELADGSGTRYALEGGIRGRHTVHVQLPPKLSCSHCVLQWTWVAGNNWGYCPDGTGRNGCGPQETFVNCADVRILQKGQVTNGSDSNSSSGNNNSVRPLKPNSGPKKPVYKKPYYPPGWKQSRTGASLPWQNILRG